MKQITHNIMMIRPCNFRYNEETAINNHYQRLLENMDSNQIHQLACDEFDNFVIMLRAVGVNVVVIEDDNQYDTPDSLFPNNWMSFHSDGNIVLYPMYASNRRKERRKDIFSILTNIYDFKISEIKDFTSYENDSKYLEGTGSMVLDRENKICYASLSPRTNKDVLIHFCEDFGYHLVSFIAKQNVNGNRLPIYHTNVMMCIADKFAVICVDTIDDEVDRYNVINTIQDTNKHIIRISEEQKNKFAGNMLQVMGEEPSLIMSKSAYESLTEVQRKEIEKYCPINYTSLDIIEACGGGSARCMMAEIFLPKNL